MASTIQLKTGTGSAVPSSLTQGEVAINIDNGLVYYGSGSGNTRKQLETFTHITASGNISSSGTIIAAAAVLTTADINGGTIDGITSLTAGGDLDIGSHAFRAATITPDGLTGGRVVFTDAGKNLIDDSRFTWNDASNTLTATNTSTSDLVVEKDDEVSSIKIHQINPTGNRTVGLNITASGNGQEFSLALNRSSTNGVGSFVIAPSGISTAGTNAVFEIDQIGNITASGNISSSGEIYATDFHAPLGINDGYHIGAGKPILAINGEGGFLSLGAAHPTYHAAGVNIYTTGSDQTKGLFLDSVGNVTASGNISSSGVIRGGSYFSDTSYAIGTTEVLKHEGGNILLPGSTAIEGHLDIQGGQHITASGNISASGDLTGKIGYFSDGNGIYTDKIRRFSDSSTTTLIKLNDEHIKIFAGSNTAEAIGVQNQAVKISGSLNVESPTGGHITASGNISASGKIYSDNIETFHGSARITDLVVNNYSGPNLQGIMRHEWTRKLTETVNDNNTIAINRQDLRTGIIIPYAFKITGFTMFYGVNENGTQTIPQGALFALSQSQMDLNDNGDTGDTNTITAICTGLGQGTKGYNSHLCTGSCDVNMPAGSSIYYRVKPTTTVSGTTMDMNYTIQWKRINE